MSWPRRLLLRLFLRLLGQVVGTDTDRVMRMDTCPRCGVWRCPDCWFLITAPRDHNIGCWRAHQGHAGGE